MNGRKREDLRGRSELELGDEWWLVVLVRRTDEIDCDEGGL